MPIKILIACLIFTFYVSSAKAMEPHARKEHEAKRKSIVLFKFPEQQVLLGFLRSQFEGQLFTGEFNHQDEKFLKMLDKYCGKELSQEEISEFVNALAPYYGKNIEDQRLRMPLKAFSATEFEILKKQDGLLKYFHDKFKRENQNINAREYFQTIAKSLLIPAKL